jgi:hypothetical protein
VKRAFLLILALSLLVAGCGSTTVTKTRTVTVAKLAIGPPREVVQYGFIKSLKKNGATYALRFDPAFLLTGKTANQAALEDTGSSDVPNDSYTVDESKRTYLYIVPAKAEVRVLTSGSKLDGTPITVAQLAALANGTSQKPKLFEPLSSGFWMRYANDTVESLDQQYHP